MGIIVDSVAPLPKNFYASTMRATERILGRDHAGNFKGFMAGGGVDGMLEELAFPVQIEHSAKFGANCREVVVLTMQH